MGIPTYYTNLLDYDGCVNLMKGAIETADCVTTVSPTYAKEILDPWFSYGMDRELVRRQDGIRGILNGIDVDLYNPETDPDIKEHYQVNRRTGKACHDHCRQHANVTQTTRSVTHQFHWQVDNTLRQAARVHDLTCQHKEGNG